MQQSDIHFGLLRAYDVVLGLHKYEARASRDSEEDTTAAEEAGYNELMDDARLWHSEEDTDCSTREQSNA